MKKVLLEIEDINPSGSSTGAYALILKDNDSGRKLPIIIGNQEAQAIAIELEQMTPTRPLTHDLFKTLCVRYEIDVEEVLIYRLNEGVFFAKIITEMDGKTVEIDSRTSDAVAIAVRFKCPIYCNEEILDEAGIRADSAEEEELIGFNQEEDIQSIESTEVTQLLSMAELEDQLQSALENEDYERASVLRDEIARRKKG
jgi:uncharacterized protein